MHNNLKESDLYTPIKQFLTNLGYQVKGEIKSCDIVAIKDDDIIIIELKLTLNITLLLQSIDRFSLADIVYIAIPKQSAIYKKKQKQVKKLVARLGLGLMVVDIQKEHAYVEVIRDPKEYTPQKNKRKQNALLKEFHQRQGDTQKGGSTTRKASLTAYRQRAIRIAEYLSKYSPASGASINKIIDEPQATQFLYNNHYGWFDRVQRGLYAISEKGETELIHWQKKQKLQSIK